MMENDNSLTEQALMAEIADFRQQQQSLILATSSAEQLPLASYAPFVEDDKGRFYLLLSTLAQHSANLNWHRAEQQTLSVLLIEDEHRAGNVFARKRLSYQCEVQIWSREHQQWSSIIQSLQEKFGNTIEVLAGLADFNIYQLTPKQGSYVRGFGQAYELKDARLPVRKQPQRN